MARRSFLDRLAGTIRLTESLSLVEDSQAVVRALSVVQWVGILQALGSVVVLLVFDESAVAWAVAGATALFLVSWAWLAVTGDMFGSVVIALLGAPVPIYVHVRLGGYAYSGGSLFFGITVASAAALLLGRRAAMLVVAGFSGAAVVLGFLESSLRASRVPPDPTLTSLLFVVVLVTNLTVVPPVLVYLLGKVRSERERAEGLLLNMLPADVASELKRTGSTTPRRYDSISVMFADIVGFTPIASEMRPVDVVENLNVVFTASTSSPRSTGSRRSEPSATPTWRLPESRSPGPTTPTLWRRWHSRCSTTPGRVRSPFGSASTPDRSSPASSVLANSSTTSGVTP